MSGEYVRRLTATDLRAPARALPKDDPSHDPATCMACQNEAIARGELVPWRYSDDRAAYAEWLRSS